jgi:hypothetical protein
MPQMGLEPTIPVLERAATVIGTLGNTAESKHVMQYTYLLSAIRSGLCYEGFAAQNLQETWSVYYDNLSDTKCTDEGQHSLLAENQKYVDPLLDPYCSSADPR